MRNSALEALLRGRDPPRRLCRGLDGDARLALLSTYLGHADPAATYWYLSAAPELLALAGQRLDNHQEQGQ